MSKMRCFIGDHKTLWRLVETFEYFTGDFDHKIYGDFDHKILWRLYWGLYS